MRADERDILIGKVIGPFGVRGEVKVIVLTDFPERFSAGRMIAVRPAVGEKTTLEIERSREHKGGLVVKLRGVDGLEQARALRQAEIVIGHEDLGDLESGRFYVFDIVGLNVVTDDGRELGEVTEVMQGGANDVYITSTGVCIPALKDVVKEVDLQKGVMVISPMPGLLPDE